MVASAPTRRPMSARAASGAARRARVMAILFTWPPGVLNAKLWRSPRTPCGLRRVEQRDEPRWRDQAVRLFHQLLDRLPVRRSIDAGADPAVAADVGRHEEPRGGCLDQHLLHA